MKIKLIDMEKKITDFWTNIVKTLFPFLSKLHQSLLVSIIHYVIFIIGYYYFFFISKPGDIFRPIFFSVILISTISFFTFNKCLFTVIERGLSKDKNIIQKITDTYFGTEIDGNISSKIVLIGGLVITGTTLLKDYGFITTDL